MTFNYRCAHGIGDSGIHRDVHTSGARLIALSDSAGVGGALCWGYCDGGGGFVVGPSVRLSGVELLDFGGGEGAVVNSNFI